MLLHKALNKYQTQCKQTKMGVSQQAVFLYLHGRFQPFSRPRQLGWAYDLPL